MRSSPASAASRSARAEPLAGQEALEHEATGGQARTRPGRPRPPRARARPRPGGPAPIAARTSRSPGSETPGVPASVTTATRSPRARRASTSPTRDASVWSLTVSSFGAGDAGALQQPAGAAGVLAGDGVRPGQRLDGPGRQVAEVADGGGDEHEGAGPPERRSRRRRRGGGAPGPGRESASPRHRQGRDAQGRPLHLELVAGPQRPALEGPGRGLDDRSGPASTGRSTRWRASVTVRRTTRSASQ